MALYFLASLFPLLVVAWGLCRRPLGSWLRAGVALLGFLLLVGGAFYVTHPFLRGTAIGTGEAYNYSLSTADAVSQFRAGYFPVLVGQTEYAFNGRIHPLRTAPYFSYAAGLVDFLTFHRLSFWEIQNLVLALSLLGGALSAYFGLRQVMEGHFLAAALLALAYILCPAVLAAAYSMDLYMTVTALPFVPLAVAGSVRTLSGNGPLSAYLQLGAGLAGAWWAHPPVALWLSLSTALFHVGRILLGQCSVKDLLRLAVSALLAALLSLFVFVSTFSITRYSTLGGGNASESVLASINQAFEASLAPISATADQLGDFQWGYAYWALFGITCLVAAVKRKSEVLLLSGIAGLLLIPVIPVPAITAWFWNHVPGALISITSQWPMQRLYLIGCVWLLFAVAQLRLDLECKKRSHAFRFMTGIALLAAIGWTGWQSWGFIKRGKLMQQAEVGTSEEIHRSENINLTITSYALFEPPSTFIHATMDPEMELRLLQRGTAEELATNWGAPPAELVEAQGTFTASGNSGDTLIFEPQLILKPTEKYRLDFSFLIPPTAGILRITGDHLRREYSLPQAGNPQGFGLSPTNRHGLTLWSSRELGDTVHLELMGFSADLPAQAGHLADFTFSRVDSNQLPMRLISLLPLRVDVKSPVPGYLETPRMFIEGYRALVDGKEQNAIRSPTGQVMVPVPAGHSVVKLNYKGTFWLNAAFWTSLGSWCALFGLIATRACFPAMWERITGTVCVQVAHFFRGRTIILLSAGIALGAIGVYCGFKYLDRAGPIKLRVVLPRDKIKQSHPLLTTGSTGAGTFVYVIYEDLTHIRVGFDAWAKNAGLSEPIEIDYFSDHEFVVSEPALYPEGHWKTRGVNPQELERLRERVIVLLDGRPILDQKVYPFPSTYSEVTVGENRIGGSTTEPAFSGKILGKTRASLTTVAKPEGATGQK